MASSAEALLSDGIKKRTTTTRTQVQELVARHAPPSPSSRRSPRNRSTPSSATSASTSTTMPRLLARMAVDETGIGVYEDKVLKKKGKARAIWNSLKGKKSRGIIGEDAETNLVFVAKPMGVVGAVTPITNPVVTPMCNGMFALKTGNAVIFAPHPKAQNCAEHLTEAFMRDRQGARRAGRPDPGRPQRLDRQDPAADGGRSTWWSPPAAGRW